MEPPRTGPRFDVFRVDADIADADTSTTICGITGSVRISISGHRRVEDDFADRAPARRCPGAKRGAVGNAPEPQAPSPEEGRAGVGSGGRGRHGGGAVAQVNPQGGSDVRTCEANASVTTAVPL
jgi:hypothetical protein